jgi:hypothetical protein
MSKSDKLIKRLLSKPKDFTYDELNALLLSKGYKEDNVGKTDLHPFCLICTHF